MEYVQQKNIEKVSRFLEKGLDPNFHDPDTGGKEVSYKKCPILTQVFNLDWSVLLWVLFFSSSVLFILLSLSLFVSLHYKMTMYGFCEISLLHGG